MINIEESLIKNNLTESLWDLPSPSSINYMWNMGATLGSILTIQVTSGLILTVHYTAHSGHSFDSVILIIREIWSGWLTRLVHINGASAFFIVAYTHIFRGIYFFSSSNNNVWISGSAILALLIAIAFLGYVLPWGQMSYWGVAVITNLVSVVPSIGNIIVNWIWGGFSVGNPTLTRFYSLHFLTPFILTGIVITHLNLLHSAGSSNPVGLNSDSDNIPFQPYFTINDTLFIAIIFTAAISLISVNPYILGEPVNNVPANAIQTPTHIQPEWYFLTYYAILRCLPTNTAGVLGLLFSVGVFFVLPIFNLNFSTNFSMLRNLSFWVFLSCFAALIWIGAMPAEEPYITSSNAWIIIYFVSLTLVHI